MKKYLFITVIVCALIAIGFLAAFNFIHRHKKSSQRDLNANINTFLKDASYTKYDKNGGRAHTLSAKEMFYVPTEDLYIFTYPVLKINPDGKDGWEITAQNAKSSAKNTIINLQTQVSVGKLKIDGHALTLTTEELTVYPNKNYAITSAPLKITEDDNIVRAIGGSINFEKNTLELWSKIQGEYILP